jgi:hypothetical protein
VSDLIKIESTLDFHANMLAVVDGHIERDELEQALGFVNSHMLYLRNLPNSDPFHYQAMYGRLVYDEYEALKEYIEDLQR